MSVLLNQVQPRTVLIAMVSGVLLLVAVIFAYVLMPTYKTYLKTEADRTGLELAVRKSDVLRNELAALRNDVEKLTRALHGDMADLPDQELEAFVIGRLQQISWRNHVELVSVKPRKGDVVQTFREVLFDVEITGDYFDLFAWLQSLTEELGFVVVKHYILRPLVSGEENPQLNAKLTIVSYRKA
jgi:Tfp pilus assembly protein PilO